VKNVSIMGSSEHLTRYIKKSPNGTKINVYDRLNQSQRPDQPIQGSYLFFSGERPDIYIRRDKRGVEKGEKVRSINNSVKGRR